MFDRGAIVTVVEADTQEDMIARRKAGVGGGLIHEPY